MKSYFLRYVEHILAPINLFVAGSAIVFLTFAGPFGTFETLTHLQRFCYWGVVVLAAVVVVTGLKLLIEIKMSDYSHLARSFALACSMAVVLSPILQVIAEVMTGAYRDVSPIWTVAIVIFFVSLFIYQLHIIILKLDIGAKPVPRFAQRLGAEGDCAVYHVSVDDHYLDVRAENGQHRLLMRFSDALAELEEMHGMRVHRSHWVSECAVQRVETSNTKMQLELIDGTKVPVSRAYQEPVTEMFADRL